MLCPCTVTLILLNLNVFLSMPTDCAFAIYPRVYVGPLLCLENKMAFIFLAAPVTKSI